MDMVIGPVYSEKYDLACAPIEYTVKTVHSRNLIRIIDGRRGVDKGRMFIQVKNYLRLRSDCVDVWADLNLYCTHMPACRVCWIVLCFIVLLAKQTRYNYCDCLFNAPDS